MGIAEMAAMTLIKNHHHLLVPHLLQMLVIIVAGYRTIEFLNCCNKDF